MGLDNFTEVGINIPAAALDIINPAIWLFYLYARDFRAGLFPPLVIRAQVDYRRKPVVFKPFDRACGQLVKARATDKLAVFYALAVCRGQSDSALLIKKSKRYILLFIGLLLFIGCDACVGLDNFTEVAKSLALFIFLNFSLLKLII